MSFLLTCVFTPFISLCFRAIQIKSHGEALREDQVEGQHEDLFEETKSQGVQEGIER